MSSTETIQALKQVPLFRNLSGEELERIAGITIERFYPKKAMVFIEGSQKEAVFFIKDGLVKTLKTDVSGHEQIVAFLKQGEMFPHTGLFNKNPYMASAESIVDTTLIAIPVHQFEQLLLELPMIAIKVLEEYSDKILELQQKIQQLSGQDVNHRALSFLLKLAEQHGITKNGYIQIDLPITHQEFASAVGTSRETINRFLNQLRKEGLIQNERNRILILDMDTLQHRVGAIHLSDEP